MPWFWEGLKSGVRTLRPRAPRLPAGVTPGRPATTAVPAGASLDPELCPVGALAPQDGAIAVDFDHCIHCMRCRPPASPLQWQDDYRWALAAAPPLPPRFQRSIHVRILDAGDCGGCLSELRQLFGPVYSLHRYGIYVSPTPRDADVLLVVGPVTVGMRVALEETYAAMPDPKRVVAVGVCALNGGLFADSFAVVGGASRVVPVDVTVPGCPPPPLAILHALELVTGSSREAREVGDS